MNSLKLLKRLWQALPLSDYNRWRLTSLLLEPVLPFIKGSVVHTAYLREKEWQAKRIRPFHGDSLPRLPRQDKADIIIWGIIDWRFRIQRPQHLARGFADRGYRVFYISTTFVNSSRPGFELERMDVPGRLYSVRFHLSGRPRIYVPPSRDDMRRLQASLARLLAWTESRGIVSIVQHPYWYEIARKLPASRLIYDCMDHHEGFGNTGEGIAALELALMKEAEAVVTTSQWLRDIVAAHSPDVALIPNAADYGFFSVTPGSIFQDPQGRRVLGYYGAIADWMDVTLLEKLARQFSDCLLLLVGADECGARQRLGMLPNVRFTGEVIYAELPHYLYGMDVCLLPFRVTPLTLATNPVKVYEYLATGKPVVSVALPELEQFGNLVATASTHDEFVLRIEEALASPDHGQPGIRRAFAAGHTWQDRVEEFDILLRHLAEEPHT
jgi:glycosyltransferase involved in cell wall biosynthesis